ncbi:MAG: hypothetical protein MPJ08_03775 [Nitrosopumilus sp.]|nr:hypothetical protein [Nitrosopumilus sp.]
MSWRTYAGIAAGVVILAIGVAALANSLLTTHISGESLVGPGFDDAYSFVAPAGSEHRFSVSGGPYTVDLSSPGGLQLDGHAGEDGEEFAWSHAEDGPSRLTVRNTGAGDVTVSYSFETPPDPLLVTYPLMVMVTGIVIVGLGIGFRMRRPRGF